ncbi:hypothetical protein GIB67_017458 [Kingdonia uniflora]|uniref:NAC domain-containing protein n=1 Tax=Kingdonia uniflora TaxID=39325 RepID=A0A7J7M4D2_9MAGN|nr:hypothetical protein GIB67_017458 [Kingdonia uniflora]
MGRRPNRVAGNGYWKATGKDVKIQQNDLTIGYRKTLVYYEKQASRGVKTNWIMHEYRIDETPDINLSTSTDMKLDDCVLCRIHYKPPKISSDPPSETNPSATTSLPPKPTITKRRIRSALPSLTEASSHSALSSSKATNPIGHAQTTPESSVEYISASNSMAINNLPSMSNYPSHMHYPVTTNQVLNNSYSHVNFTGSGNGFQYVDPLYTQPPQEFYDGNYSSLETVPFGSTNPNFYPSAFDGTNQNFHPETSGTNQHLYVPNQQDSAMGDSYFEKLGIHFDEFGNAYDQYNGAHPMNTHYQKP